MKPNSLPAYLLKPELSRRKFLWLLSACAAAPTLTGCAINPVTGESQFMIMSEAQEIAVDQQQAPHQFSGDYGSVQDLKLNNYVSLVGLSLAAISHRQQVPYSFRAVNANYINAYAFPGGSIAVTRGILVNLKNESELAGLLGHELGHVNARHTAERMSKGTLINLALAGAGMALGRLGENVGDMAQQLGQLGGTALLAHYSRDDERQADSLGMEYMVKANHNPHGMVGLMALLRSLSQHNASALEQMFSTHPMSDERFATAEHVANTRYLIAKNAPTHRDRFMDNTANLRKLKPTIDALDQAERLMAQKQYGEAEQRAESALKHTPRDYSALVVRAKLYLQQEKYKEAQPYLEKATGVYPTEAQAHHLLGITHLTLEKPEAALQQFQDYDKLLPGNPNTIFLQGISLENMQRKPEAAERYTAFLQQVNQGQQAQYAYQRLIEWGYVQRPAS